MQGEKRDIDWRLVALFYLVMLALLVGKAWFNAPTAPLLQDTDDAMRLVEVRDFLAGQPWYDLTQHRLDTPYGAPMHWSRLVDLPIASLLLVFRPLAGDAATTIVAYVYPLLLLLAVLWITARLSVMLGGREALLPGLALPVFSLVTLIDFAPGRFDHHSMQVLLTLLLLAAAIASIGRPRLAIGAGIAAALALAIGIESLPGVVGAILAYGLLWVFDARHAAALRLFGVSFALATVACLVLTIAPQNWLAPACDTISPVYALAAIGVGILFPLLSMLRLSSRPGRLAVGALAGAALVATVALLFPDCLRGPYAALDPWLMANWMARIEEAQPFHRALLLNPSYTLAVGLPPLFALAVALWQVFRAPSASRERWLVYLAFLILAVVVMLWQVRAARMAMCLSIPAGAALIAMARAAYLRHAGIGSVLGLLMSWLGFAGLAVALAVNLVTAALPGPAPQVVAGAASGSPAADCRLPSDFTSLAALPAQRVMAPIDLGAHILAFTPHSVVGAPYHRAARGIRDTFDFFNRPLAEARQILAARGVTLVVTCPGMAELKGLADATPDSFVRRSAAGTLPDWLEREDLPGTPLEIYRVR